jgi:hypothetical protein
MCSSWSFAQTQVRRATEEDDQLRISTTPSLAADRMSVARGRSGVQCVETLVLLRSADASPRFRLNEFPHGGGFVLVFD